MINIFKKASLTSLVGDPQVTSYENEILELKDQIKFYEHMVAQLQAIRSAMPDPYYVRDMDYNIVLWPAAIAKLMGYTETEAKGMKCYDIFKACVCPPGSQCPTTQCIQDRKFLKDVAVDVYRKDGEVVHSLVSNAGVYDANGNPMGAVEIVKDNSSVQKAMAAIGETIKKIDVASAGLNAAMETVNNISQKVSENADDSLAGIKKGVEAGNGADKKAGDSAKNAGDVQANMKNINDSMKFSIEKIAALKEKSALISDFIDVIQRIAAKTNLLAINASIEAAHAGEAGRGFKVVADGIRELSKNSQESALSIQATINEINGLVNEATSSMNVTEKDIESGTQTISGLLAFVDEITQSIKEIMFSMQTIESAAITTSGLIGEQNNSVAEVSSIGRELSTIANELTDRVRDAIKYANMG